LNYLDRLCDGVPSLQALHIQNDDHYCFLKKLIEIDVRKNRLKEEDSKGPQDYSNNADMFYLKLIESPEEKEWEKSCYYSVDCQGLKTVTNLEYNSGVCKGKIVCFQIRCLYLEKLTVKFKRLYKERQLH
jgi:hypothetical protein